jgi:hypothetical protein
MGDLQLKLRGRVLRLDPRRRVATIQLPRVGDGRSFRTDIAMPGEALSTVLELGYDFRDGRTVGAVTAVRPRDNGVEVDVHVTGDSAWQRLAERKVRVDVTAAFTGTIGLDPVGGRVERVEID